MASPGAVISTNFQANATVRDEKEVTEAIVGIYEPQNLTKLQSLSGTDLICTDDWETLRQCG
jgi:hypothetical protein